MGASLPRPRPQLQMTFASVLVRTVAELHWAFLHVSGPVGMQTVAVSHVRLASVSHAVHLLSRLIRGGAA